MLKYKFNLAIFLACFLFSLSFLDNLKFVNFLGAALVFFVIIFLTEEKSGIQMMFVLGYATFIYYAAIINSIYLDIDFKLFYASSICTIYFLKHTNKLKYRPRVGDQISFVPIFFLLFLYISIGSLFIGNEYINPFYAFYVFSFAMILQPGNKKYNAIVAIFFIISFAVYMNSAFSGFGRIVPFGWLITGFLYFCYNSNIGVNRFFFFNATPLMTTLLSNRDLYSLNFADLEESINDSAFGPYQLASNFFIDYKINGLDVIGFIEQILFTFFVFIPRSIWPTKPYGFGFEYTVKNLPDYLIDAGHSIAATMIGEHIYYLGYFGIFTGLSITLILARLSTFLYGIKIFNGNGVVVLACSIMVYAWGGMSSLAARLALALIIFFIFTAIIIASKEKYKR